MTQATRSTSPVTIGLDLGDRTTHCCVLQGSAVRERMTARTTHQGIDQALANYPGAQVVLEAGSQSPWLSRHLRAKGFQVHVVDPRRVQLISKDPRKTDRRDAEMLARLENGVPELLGRVHHRGEQAQADLALIRARDQLVQARTCFVQHVRGTAKAFGVRLPTCSTASFPGRVRELVPEVVHPAIEVVLSQVDALTKSIKELDRRVEKLAEERYPEIRKLQAIHGVGPMTSTAFVLTIESPERFEESRKVGSWVGLCPRSFASGDSDPMLGISKSGDGYLRRLLVQSANRMLQDNSEDSELRRFGQRLLARGGAAAKKKAITAVARKLAVLLHHLWRRDLSYDPFYNTNRKAAAAA